MKTRRFYFTGIIDIVGEVDLDLTEKVMADALQSSNPAISKANVITQKANDLSTDYVGLVERLKTELVLGVVGFIFLKKDGTLRKAIGTLKPQVLEKFVSKKAAEDIGDRKPIKSDAITYFDLDAMAFRSCGAYSIKVIF